MKNHLTQEPFAHGITGYVVFDEDPLNPRTEYDNVATMACWHGRYHLGDKEQKGRYDETDFLAGLLGAVDIDAQCPACQGRGVTGDGDWGTLADCPQCQGYGYRPKADLWRLVYERYLILPLFLYDHSGLSISTSRGYPFNCPWDSGQVGWIYVTKERARQEWGRLSDAEYFQRLCAEVQTYDVYLTGQCFGYVIEDAQGNTLDSCYGYLDDEDYCRTEMRQSALCAVEYAGKEQAEAAYWRERDVQTMEELTGELA